MHPLIPEDLVGQCIELACYFVAAVSAAVSWMFVGKI
jgi:hypothetical protein